MNSPTPIYPISTQTLFLLPFFPEYSTRVPPRRRVGAHGTLARRHLIAYCTGYTGFLHPHRKLFTPIPRPVAIYPAIPPSRPVLNSLSSLQGRILDGKAYCSPRGWTYGGRALSVRLRPYQVENTVSRPINVSQAT